MRKVLIVAVLTLLALSTSAQTLISRSALDSLMRPALLESAEGMLSVDCKVRDVGTISDSRSLRLSYTLHNNHTESITIVSMRASCSCLRILSDSETIVPEGEYQLWVEFNPAGRSGAFSYDITIYTSLDATHPTERLTLKGEIERSDRLSHLPYQMGALRLSRKSVSMEQVTTSATRREHIAVANCGSQIIRPTARTTVEGLSLRCEPEVLAPGQEGDLVVEYRPTRLPSADVETMVIIEGVEASATDRIIRIMIKR